MSMGPTEEQSGKEQELGSVVEPAIDGALPNRKSLGITSIIEHPRLDDLLAALDFVERVFDGTGQLPNDDMLISSGEKMLRGIIEETSDKMVFAPHLLTISKFLISRDVLPVRTHFWKAMSEYTLGDKEGGLNTLLALPDDAQLVYGAEIASMLRELGRSDEAQSFEAKLS